MNPINPCAAVLVVGALAAFVVVGCGLTESDTPLPEHIEGKSCSEEGSVERAADGCNTCSCSGGKWSCTTIACDAACTDRASKPAGDDCNTCRCSNGIWTCTKRACPICAPGSTKPSDDGCNTCACSDDGLSWMCTTSECGACPMPAVFAHEYCGDAPVWAKNPRIKTCCQYEAPCLAPTGWPKYNSLKECTLCAPPRKLPDSVSCPPDIAYAKDPKIGICCEYPDPCHVPEGYERCKRE